MSFLRTFIQLSASCASGLSEHVQRMMLAALLRVGDGNTLELNIDGGAWPQGALSPLAGQQKQLEDGIMWYCPTPKKRTTAEKKLTKRFAPLANNFITKYSVPKRNIVACLDCGAYHETGTICGKCYTQLKRHIKEMSSGDQIFKSTGDVKPTSTIKD